MAPPIRRHTYGPIRTKFDPARPLYVRRDFNGHRRGERFDVAGIAPMRLAGMFSSALLTHSAPAVEVSAAPTDPPRAARRARS